MEIINKLIDFKVSIKNIENVGNVVFSECEFGIWHDIARDYVSSEGNVFLLVENNQVVSITKDPTEICPYENSSIFEIKNNIFKVGDYVHFDGVDLVKIEAPTNILFTKYDGGKWVCEKSLDEQLEYYKNMIIKKTRELGVHEAAGFYNATLAKELEELKKKHMEISHELANQINLTY